MKKRHNMIIIGGTGRNVGKTEFVCRLISRFSQEHTIYGLKVSAVIPEEIEHHGDHADLPPGVSLFEENNRASHKDTSRMLRSGASRVYFLCGDSDALEEGIGVFLGSLPDDVLVVCESNSLAEYIQPALNIVVTTLDGEVKERARVRLETADLVVFSTGSGGFPQLKRIVYDTSQGWCLSENNTGSRK